jgi:cell division septal protein FtsQ
MFSHFVAEALMMAAETEPKVATTTKSSASLTKIPLRFLVAVLVTGFLLTVVAMRWQTTRKISRIVVSGTTLIPSHEIVDMVNIPDDSLTINEMSFSLIERRVARHPFVKSVAAFRSSGDAIMLKVQERKPIAHILYKNKQMYVDAEGALLPYRLVSGIVDVPLISFAGRAVLDSATLLGALAILQTLDERDKDLARNVSEIQARPHQEYALILAAGATPALLGKAEDLEDKITRLGLFWRQHTAQMTKRAFGYIDVRWTGQVVTRPASELP